MKWISSFTRIYITSQVECCFIDESKFEIISYIKPSNPHNSFTYEKNESIGLPIVCIETSNRIWLDFFANQYEMEFVSENNMESKEDE